MPRAPRETRLETAEARLKLKVRAEPYWRHVIPGTFLGYRRGRRAGVWVVRQRAPDGQYREQRLATSDDHAPADGMVVLSYKEAVLAATQPNPVQHTARPRHYQDGPALIDLVDQYLDEHLAGRGSEKVARGLVSRHVREDIGRKAVRQLRAEDYTRWLKGLARKPPTRGGKVMPFDPKDPAQANARRQTANRVWTIVKAALNHADQLGRMEGLTREWMKVKSLPVADDGPPRMLAEDEARALLAACEEPAFKQLVTAALMTGARYGDLCALRVSDFDPITARITLRQSKTGKRLNQPLTAEGAAFFAELVEGRLGSELLLRRLDGRPWRKGDQARPLRAAAQAAGITDISFKVTRATYGKLLLIATRDIELVAKALGHSDTRITRKHYAQLLPDEVSRGVALLPSLGLKS